MKQYKDLTENQKAFFERIESMFTNHNSVSVQAPRTAAKFLINKYKKIK